MALKRKRPRRQKANSNGYSTESRRLCGVTTTCEPTSALEAEVPDLHCIAQPTRNLRQGFTQKL
eukprot:3747009-Amphidinium_carterae.1